MLECLDILPEMNGLVIILCHDSPLTLEIDDALFRPSILP